MTILRTLVAGSSLLIALSGCSIFSSQRGTPSARQSAPTGWDPTVACAHLSEKLTPGLYKNESGNVFACISSTKNLGAGSPPNNIAYYARGEAQRARQVGVVLNVNNLESADDALRTLKEYSDELSLKALGVPLSKTATNAILSGNPGRGTVDTTKVEIVRHDFSNGKGYELHYVITPRL
jgi:hypothetical protein